MTYWNRDLIPAEPFRCWHDDCFPVRKPYWHEVRGFDSREALAADVLGGIDHLVHLVLTDSYYADRYVEYVTATDRCTPRGYAWGPWQGGAPCDACGKDC